MVPNYTSTLKGAWADRRLNRVNFSEVVGFIIDANSGHRASLASTKNALGSAVL